MARTLMRGSPGPSFVVRVEPEDGAAGVMCDAPILLRVSRPLDPQSMSPLTFRLLGPRGVVACRLELSPDGRVIIAYPPGALFAGGEHLLTVEGLRDRDGGEVAPHRSRFLPCGHSRAQLTDPG